MPTALDFGDIDQAFYQSPENRSNNLGAKGLGETDIDTHLSGFRECDSPGTGIRFLSIPITRDQDYSRTSVACRARSGPWSHEKFEHVGRAILIRSHQPPGISGQSLAIAGGRTC